ncbi:MAG: cytochrome c oxidase assembly protein, partial [Sphingomicrobium sp.]
EPVQRSVIVAPGARTQILYRAENLSDHAVTGRAVFNVSPDQAGRYFNKIACFCFTEQTLKPHEKVDMPVVFFVDPRMMDDKDARTVEEITLSYTFYPVETGANSR